MNEQLVEVLQVGGPWAAILLTIVGASWRVSKDEEKRQRAKRLQDLKKKTVTSQTLRQYINSKQLDPTKRKSLQPTNQRPMPVGWTEEDEELWKAANKVPKRSPNGPVEPLASIPPQDRKGDNVKPAEGYVHKFFGSRLMVENHVIKGGMTNKLHRLEVTRGDKVYIDGEPVSMNPSDIEKLKYWLDKIQGA